VGQNLQDLGSVVEVEAHDGQQGNRASDGEVRRPWRCVAVPGAGPDQGREQGEEVRKHRAKGIWSGGCG
jgi:hypothetical protein